MKYDIEALKRKMLVKYPFFGSVVANVDYKESKDISTAGTDGKTVYYNSEYLERLSVEEQTFVFAHEVCHIAFNHILRSEGKDQKLWNVVTDAIINQFLKQDGLKIVLGCIDIAEAINYNSEQLYEKLFQSKKQDKENNPQQQNSNNQSRNNQQVNLGSKSSQGCENQLNNQSTDSSKETSQKEETSKQDVGHDTHSMWENAVKEYKKQQEKSAKKEEKDKMEPEKKQKELESMGEKNAFKKNLEDKKKQLEELKEAIAKQSSQAGTSTNSDIRKVNNIGFAKPLINWQYILRETINYDVDWSYKNATIEDGVVSANLEFQPIPETEIVLDTSGSINEVLLKNFLRECKNILPYTKLKVGCFDTKFYGFHEIRTEKDIEHMQFEGGGGTDFNIAVNAFSRRVENKVIFTDGEASMPSISLDAIWIVFGGEKINPKGGKVIYITSEQLDKLWSSKNKSRSR